MPTKQKESHGCFRQSKPECSAAEEAGDEEQYNLVT